MTDHTPGPWKAECIGVSDFGPNGVDVYEITNGYTRIAEAVFDRDAALVAAAPELLEALSAIQTFCDDPAGSEHWETLALGLSRLLPAARQAIAKATGQ